MKTEDYIRLWMEEDEGPGDYSSLSCISESQIHRAALRIKEEGILAGIELAAQIYRTVCRPETRLHIFIQDGQPVKAGDCAFEVEGYARDILKTERIILNCMQRMSGIATLTHRFCQAVKGTRAVILDTRKTTPLFRYFEKWAVRIGGGQNHRMGLYDMIMLKDNHITCAGGISAAISKTRKYLEANNLNLKIEIEIRNLDELEEALATGNINRILLDNFSVSELKKAVDLIDYRYETEASGNITLENAREYALTGVDFISAGCLTHSYKSLDLSLKTT